MAEGAGVKGRLCRSATLDSGALSHRSGCMNTTEGSMHHPPNGNRFEALDIALQAAGTAIGLVSRVPAMYRSLADQVVVPEAVVETDGPSCYKGVTRMEGPGSLRSSMFSLTIPMIIDSSINHPQSVTSRAWPR